MIQSLRARTCALIAVVALLGAISGGVAAWAFAERGDAVSTQVESAIIVASATGLVLLIFGAIGLVHRFLTPVSGLARASREITQGRHPDEALDRVPLSGELFDISEGVRTLALRLREIDATDRRFLMSVSHELRTPLTAITGHAQAIEDFPDEAEMRGQSLQVIRREAERLERLVEDIVDLARLRSNRFTTVTEAVMLDELGEHLLAIFDGAAKPEVLSRGPSVSGHFEAVPFHSDGQRILQILRNLVGNGLRYAETGVRIEGVRDQGRVRISVVNDGPEITSAQREKIFEPFVGTKREGGMGLGLAIGRELAWALGGNLESLDHDGGARFELTLPLEPPDFGR